MTPEYDVIIIGAGINGAAIAAAVAARGYRTLVLEQGDFASGTTSASTKLIHGGLRYLATGDAALVHESLQSRERLLRKRPHLVQPLGFLLPVYRGDPRPAAVVRAGLLLYDLLSPRKVTPWHRSFTTRQLQRIEPAISTDNLTGAYRFYDAQVEMPERLTLEYLAEARSSGADLRNYAAVDYIIVDRQRARGVDFHDVLTGKRSSAAARLVINAAGPWVDAVLEATGRSLQTRIGGTRGSHLVLDLQRRGPRHAVLISAKSDGRPIFVVPWLDHHILGATDIHDDGDPAAARIQPWEVDYLIAEAARALPRHRHRAPQRPLRLLRHPPTPTRRRRRLPRSHHPAAPSSSTTAPKASSASSPSSAANSPPPVDSHAKSPSKCAAPSDAPAHAVSARSPPNPTHAPPSSPPTPSSTSATPTAHAPPTSPPTPPPTPNSPNPSPPHHRDIGAQVAFAVDHEGARTVADILLSAAPPSASPTTSAAAPPPPPPPSCSTASNGPTNTANKPSATTSPNSTAASPSSTNKPAPPNKQPTPPPTTATAPNKFRHPRVSGNPHRTPPSPSSPPSTPPTQTT